jgi:FkbM family methyltransferase
MRRWIAISDSLKTLRNAGLQVSAVIDVGVQHDTKELRVAYPDVPHLLFEPIVEYHDAIRASYEGVNYQLIGSAVSSSSGTLLLKQVRADADGVVSHVMNGEVEGQGTRRVPCVALDDFFAQHEVAKPYLLKVDVDGTESDILRGAASTMRDCSCLIVETTMPFVEERCRLARESGLRLWDIVDFNFYHGSLYQVDLIFVSEREIARCRPLDPYNAINRGFEASAWFAH